MRDALLATNRPILYAICNKGHDGSRKWGTVTANSWRTTIDIQRSWDSMAFNFLDTVTALNNSGPGHWNDPDMLQVGNVGMSYIE
jgi:alpha-galactosidase